jgi:hypothetical protein
MVAEYDDGMDGMAQLRWSVVRELGFVRGVRVTEYRGSEGTYLVMGGDTLVW